MYTHPDIGGPPERTQPNVTRTPQWQPGAPPPPFAGTPGTSPRRTRPGRAWYLLALVVFLSGAVWLIFGILGVKGQVDGFQRVPLPQGGLVSLQHSGGYVLYYEAPGAASGQFPSFNVTIVPASSSARAQSLEPYTADVNYSFGSRQGRAVLTLQISHPGTFRVVTTGAPTVAGGSDLAFGTTIAGGIVGTVLISVLLIGLGIVGGIALFVVRLTSRRAQMRVPPAEPQYNPAMGSRPGPQMWPQV
jgi:hypothetical protein